MSGFMPVRLKQFVRQYLRIHKDADGPAVTAAVEDALAAWRQGVRCACGNPLWVAGSAVAGYGCFSCITGSAEPDGDPEIDTAFDGYLWGLDIDDAPFDRLGEEAGNHSRDDGKRMGALGFSLQDDEYDRLFEEEAREEQAAVPETERQRWLVHFLDDGGPVTRQVLRTYLEERNSERSNVPLIRKYYKQANPNLKAILLNGLAVAPTDPDLLDDLSYFSDFDSMLGELIGFYTDACLKETDLERFSMLAQDFHFNTHDQGYDALFELSSLFRSGTKGAVVQHLCTAVDDDGESADIPF